MDYLGLEEAAQQLSDLEVALLLSLAAQEHCLIETNAESIQDLAQELALICSESFELSYSIIDCGPSTSIEDIHNDILSVDARKFLARPPNQRLKTESSSNISSYLGRRDRSKSPLPSATDEPNVVNVIIAKNLNWASDDLQVQFLHFMRARSLVTTKGALFAPADFLFIPLVGRELDKLHPPIKTHLNDNLLISHFHGHTDAYAHLEEDGWISDGETSASSVIHTHKPSDRKDQKRNQQMVKTLREASEAVTTSAEVVRYIQDIVIFLRLSRAVAGGVTAKANFQFTQLARLLAPLHGIDYLTPSIVMLAARKVFRHRIVVATPGDDRSLQYGSDLSAVAQILADVTPDSILDGVLALEPPI